MKNLTAWAVACCLVLCLIAAAGCGKWDWPSRSQDDQVDLSGEQVAQQETPEQKTIRDQREAIESLRAENESLKDDIVELAKVVTGLQEDINEYQFALDKQQVINQSMTDALDQRDRFQAQARALTDENRQLKEQVDLLQAEADNLNTIINTLNEQNKALLDSMSDEADQPSSTGGNGDQSQDQGDVPIHFGD